MDSTPQVVISIEPEPTGFLSPGIQYPDGILTLKHNAWDESSLSLPAIKSKSASNMLVVTPGNPRNVRKQLGRHKASSPRIKTPNVFIGVRNNESNTSKRVHSARSKRESYRRNLLSPRPEGGRASRRGSHGDEDLALKKSSTFHELHTGPVKVYLLKYLH